MEHDKPELLYYPKEHQPNRYEQAITGPPLNGERPVFLIINTEGIHYLRIEDAADYAGLSMHRIRDLITAKRINEKSFNSRSWFVLVKLV